MNMFESTLRLFKSVVVKNSKNLSDIPNEKALKYGVFISKDVSDNIIDEAIKQYGRNGEELNQTFHKSLFKVANADIEQLYYEQLLHYFTTYGAEALGVYSSDNVIIPKEKLEVPELKEDTKLIVIKPITEDELILRINNLITQNLALSKTTVNDIMNLSDYINIDMHKNTDGYFTDIKNKEIKIALCSKFNILPKRGDEFLRYILAKYCNKTLLIKDEETKRAIRFIDEKELIKVLDRYNELYGFIPLAETYNRFKDLFISMKRKVQPSISNYYKEEDLNAIKRINKIINHIMRLSKDYHKPMPINDLNNFIDYLDRLKKNLKSNDDYIKIVTDKVKDSGVYTAIKLLNYLEYIKCSNLDYSMYKIRNNKIFIKDKINYKSVDSFDILLLKNIIKNYLKENVSGKTVYIPHNVLYKLPQSEKQFVGNIPFGTKILFNKQPLLVGIHWCNYKDDNREVRTDIDLHLTSEKYNLGWNTSYRKDDDILFTGDNTNAPLPLGASEFMYISNDVENTTFNLKLNNYTRDVGPLKYELIIASGYYLDKDSLNKNFVVDPNSIIAKIPMEMELGKAEQVIGILDINDSNINFTFTDLVTSNSSVSGNKQFEEKLRNFIKIQTQTQLDLGLMLIESGARIVDGPTILVEVSYVLDENMNLIKQEEADEKGITYTGDEMYFRKEEVPVDFDFSLEALTKDSFIKLLSFGIEG